MRTHRIIALAGAGALAASMLTTTPATAATDDDSSSAASRVVARKDVNGNGKKDVVRFRKKSEHKFVVRVKTDHGKVDRRVVRAPYIEFGGWHGAARLDGHRGRELVLLTEAGAHSLSYTVLTWRRGKLRVLPSPDGGSWFTDGAAMMGAGWLRKVRKHHGKPTVSMTSRYLLRNGTRPRWHGKATRYVWRHGDWHKRGTHKIKLRGGYSKAEKRFGWRGTGLRPFPR